jgi:hypothetical protein
MSSNNGQPAPPEPTTPADAAEKSAAPEKPPPLGVWPLGCWFLLIWPTTVGAALLNLAGKLTVGVQIRLEAWLLAVGVGLAALLRVAEWAARLVQGKGVEKPQPEKPRKPS